MPESNGTLLFDSEYSEKSDLLSFGDAGKRLDIVCAGFLKADSLSWEELFDGFDTLYAITCSSSVDWRAGVHTHVRLLNKTKQKTFLVFGKKI